MISRRIVTSLVPLVGLLCACYQPFYTPETGDEYYGPFDATVLDSKLLPVTTTCSATVTSRCCPAGRSPCYPAQQFSLRGNAIPGYHLGNVTLTTATVAASAVASAPYAYDFPDQCVAGEEESLSEPFPHDRQFPLFSGLPLPASGTNVTWPFVRVTWVYGVSDNPCNAIKRTTTVESGAYNAQVGDVAAATGMLWAVIDPGAAVIPLRPSSTFVPRMGWFKGLLLSYLDGAALPRNPAGAVLTMEGVLVNPTTGSPSLTTTNNVVILPFGLGEAGYSPIVRLRSFTAAAGRAPSSYTALCSATSAGGLPACTGAPNEVDMNAVPTTVNNTFILLTSNN